MRRCHRFGALRALALGLALLGAGCSSAPKHAGPPKAQDDICAIFAERPGWREATQAAALRWGVPVEIQMAIVWKESNFRAAVRPMRQTALGRVPASTAYGYAQAIDGTWDWYREETGQSRADRTEFDDAVDFVGWYVNKTVATTRIAAFDAYGQYLAYHEGHTGYRRGAWQQKTWLKEAASKVASQASLYGRQLRRCS
ncbi:MAG: transglycosylase SLT domain-containing protein [Pseudomonadota bacterium]